ncbi:MAG TPA: SRPBCC domain-containing protein [Planctomycetota bacterium]|nr:SRPBCC domain-containing protein [Planctomycetota bacterium]
MSKQAAKPSVVYVTHIRTTPKKLWMALTSGRYLQQYWYGRRFRTSWQVGSPMQVLTPDGKLDWDGKVLVYDPPRQLSYTFQIMGYMKKSSRVVFDLAKQGAVVKLTVTHYDVERRCVAGTSAAWPAFCSTIKSLLETGKPLPLQGWA